MAPIGGADRQANWYRAARTCLGWLHAAPLAALRNLHVALGALQKRISHMNGSCELWRQKFSIKSVRTAEGRDNFAARENEMMETSYWRAPLPSVCLLC